MKAAPFEYFRATSVAEVCTCLGEKNFEDCKIIAGGQTLVPLMAMRLARPTHVIDINRVDTLDGIRDHGDNIEIGAVTRQCAAEKSEIIRQKIPLLAKALPNVGHLQTRNRGTVGGSIAHGDPSAEIPLVALTLGATLTLQSQTGTRQVEANEFFISPMSTALAEDELLTNVRIPVWTEDAKLGCAFHEVAPRKGDYALVSAAIQLALDDDGTCVRAAVGVGGCGPTPLRLFDVEATLVGQPLDTKRFDAACAIVEDTLDPESTPQASANYRRRVAPELVRQALTDAMAEATQ